MGVHSLRMENEMRNIFGAEREGKVTAQRMTTRNSVLAYSSISGRTASDCRPPASQLRRGKYDEAADDDPAVVLFPDQGKGSSTSAYVSSCRLVLLFHLCSGDAAGSCFGVIIIRLKSFHSAETGSRSAEAHMAPDAFPLVSTSCVIGSC